MRGREGEEEGRWGREHSHSIITINIIFIERINVGYRLRIKTNKQDGSKNVEYPSNIHQV